MVIGGMGGCPNLDIELFANCLRLSGEGFEKTDSNCVLSMLVFDTGSVRVCLVGMCREDNRLTSALNMSQRWFGSLCFCVVKVLVKMAKSYSNSDK